MSNEDDYDILIDDLDDWEPEGGYSPKVWTKATVQSVINDALRSRPEEVRSPKGLEIDVGDEWREVLLKDGTILGDYQKLGWKVMWYNKHSLGPGRGDLIRSWLSFRDRNYISKER